MKIFDESVDKLITALEEGARASKDIVDVFVEPAEGTLTRAKNKRHHLIFGRRGSGKSSLLIKSAEDLAKEGFPSIYIDLEPFKGHRYPDIIISVLISIIIKLRIFFEEFEAKPKLSGRYFWEIWKPKFSDKEIKRQSLIKSFVELENDLREKLDRGDITKFTSTKAAEKSSSNQIAGNAGTNDLFGGSNKIEASIATSNAKKTEAKSSEEYEKTKSDLLITGILRFRELIEKATAYSGRAIYIFLDDLYHVKKEDQASLIDYVHRILKGNQGFLKIGTIKTRSKWYQNAPQPMGLKIGDDADEINLDKTLEKFISTRYFLKSILNEYNRKVNGDQSTVDYVSDTGMDRLVLASGGVARDFLGLFRRAISEARERLNKDKKHHRGPNIAAEDVNLAAGAYGETKREEFQRDTEENTMLLETAFEKIRLFCMEVIKKNIFLVDTDEIGNNYSLLEELIDLRLIHQVKSRVTTTEIRYCS